MTFSRVVMEPCASAPCCTREQAPEEKAASDPLPIWGHLSRLVFLTRGYLSWGPAAAVLSTNSQDLAVPSHTTSSPC